MKTTCPPVYHHNGFVVTHALEHMIVHHVPNCRNCHKAIVVITRKEHCFHDQNFLDNCYSKLKYFLLSLMQDVVQFCKKTIAAAAGKGSLY